MIAMPDALEAEPELRLATGEPRLAPRAKPRPEEPAEQDATDEILYLIGRPTLKHFVRFVRNHAVTPPAEATLAAEWQAANRHVRTLEQTEAAAADHPSITRVDVSPKYEPFFVEFLKDPLVRHGFNTVPTEIAFVELDRLVVYQKHIDLTFVRQLQNKLGPAPTEEEVFRTCLPYDHPQPPAKWSRVEGDQFVFVSPSNDLRFLGAMPLRSNHLKDYPPPGNLVGVVGLAVGFGSNFLNAVAAENRIILNNGSHRAYALRDLGITHVPCIVQHVSSRDELELVASSEIRRNPDAYLKHPRPSMLKDYFDPRLRKVMPVHRTVRQITVKFEVNEFYVPAL